MTWLEVSSDCSLMVGMLVGSAWVPSPHIVHRSMMQLKADKMRYVSGDSLDEDSALEDQLSFNPEGLVDGKIVFFLFWASTWIDAGLDIERTRNVPPPLKFWPFIISDKVMAGIQKGKFDMW